MPTAMSGRTSKQTLNHWLLQESPGLKALKDFPYIHLWPKNTVIYGTMPSVAFTRQCLNQKSCCRKHACSPPCLTSQIIFFDNVLPCYFIWGIFQKNIGNYEAQLILSLNDPIDVFTQGGSHWFFWFTITLSTMPPQSEPEYWVTSHDQKPLICGNLLELGNCYKMSMNVSMVTLKVVASFMMYSTQREGLNHWGFSTSCGAASRLAVEQSPHCFLLSWHCGSPVFHSSITSIMAEYLLNEMSPPLPSLSTDWLIFYLLVFC